MKRPHYTMSRFPVGTRVETSLGPARVVAILVLPDGTGEWRLRGTRGDWFWDARTMAKYGVEKIG